MKERHKKPKPKNSIPTNIPNFSPITITIHEISFLNAFLVSR